MNKKVYKSMLLALPVLLAAGLLAKRFIPVFMNISAPCVFYTLTGFYCPGCGGTRAVLSLLHGHFLRSFFYHPVVIYTLVVFLWYYCSNTIEFLSKGKISIGMKLKTAHLLTGLIIILLQCLIKNIVIAGGFPYPVKL